MKPGCLGGLVIGQGIADEEAACWIEGKAAENIGDNNRFFPGRSMHLREKAAHVPLLDDAIHFLMRRPGDYKGWTTLVLQQIQRRRDSWEQRGGDHAVKHRCGKLLSSPLHFLVARLLASDLFITIPQFFMSGHPAMSQMIPDNSLLHGFAIRSEQLGKGLAFDLG